MQQTAFTRKRLYQWGAGLALAAAAVWARSLLWNAALQLFFGMLVALIALPLMRLYEKKCSVGVAASLAMTSLSVALGVFLAMMIPLFSGQVRQLAAFLPTLIEQAQSLIEQAQSRLATKGINLSQESATLMSKGQSLVSTALPQAMEKAGGVMNSLGKLFFAPVFAYYFLRDRRRISARLLLCVPKDWRETAVRAVREMRRETAGYLRGQLLVSAVVGAMTSLGLLLCGVPAWLLLGAAMGILELIPYVGPFLGGALAVVFSLPLGRSRTLWALGVVVLVQQLEGGMLSPQLMSGATRLHPVAVLLCLMLGGSVGGVMGVLFSVPLVLCVRAVLRVVSAKMAEDARKNAAP